MKRTKFIDFNKHTRCKLRILTKTATKNYDNRQSLRDRNIRKFQPQNFGKNRKSRLIRVTEITGTTVHKNPNQRWRSIWLKSSVQKHLGLLYNT